MNAITAAMLSSLVILCGCSSSHLTDERLIAAFETNRDLFAKLAARSSSGDLSCPYPNDPDICIPKGSKQVFAELKRRTAFKDAQMYVKTGPPRVLWIPVQLSGILSISSSVFGYVYSPSALRPLVGDVWQDVEDRAAYKRIAEDWYLFIGN